MADKKVGAKEILSGGGEKKKETKKSGKHKFGETRIKHHKNGSHTMEHIPDHDGTTPPGPSTSYAVSDLDGVHDGLEEHLGGPNEGEGTDGTTAPMPPPAAA